MSGLEIEDENPRKSSDQGCCRLNVHAQLVGYGHPFYILLDNRFLHLYWDTNFSEQKLVKMSFDPLIDVGINWWGQIDCRGCPEPICHCRGGTAKKAKKNFVPPSPKRPSLARRRRGKWQISLDRIRFVFASTVIFSESNERPNCNFLGQKLVLQWNVYQLSPSAVKFEIVSSEMASFISKNLPSFP